LTERRDKPAWNDSLDGFDRIMLVRVDFRNIRTVVLRLLGIDLRKPLTT
jgi:hypothetical protein